MGEGNQFTVTPEQLGRLANTLDGSMDKLRGFTPSNNEVDARISTGVVAETVGKLYKSIGSMTADSEYQIHEVQNSGGEYTRSDEQAESELPPIAIPPNLEGDH